MRISRNFGAQGRENKHVASDYKNSRLVKTFAEKLDNQPGRNLQVCYHAVAAGEVDEIDYVDEVDGIGWIDEIGWIGWIVGIGWVDEADEMYFVDGIDELGEVG